MTKLAYTCQFVKYLIQLIKNALSEKIHRQEKAKYIEMMICIQSLLLPFLLRKFQFAFISLKLDLMITNLHLRRLWIPLEIMLHIMY